MTKLRQAGHDVLTATEAGLLRKPDHVLMEAVIATDRMILTINCGDFVELSESKVAKGIRHPGILLVYRFNVPSKEMSHGDIIRAIANLEEIGIERADQCHSLNSYKY